MNFKQQSTLKRVAQVIAEQSILVNYIEWSTVRDTWQSAVYYNKMQNSLLKDGLNEDIVYTYKGKKYYNVRARKEFNRLQWFQLLICEYCFIPIDKAREITQEKETAK